MISNLPRTTPEIHELAVRIATTCRIVVQPVLPPDTWAEAEWKFYLSCRGELELAREDRSEPVVTTRP